jgi:hypothetical protein
MPLTYLPQMLSNWLPLLASVTAMVSFSITKKFLADNSRKWQGCALEKQDDGWVSSFSFWSPKAVRKFQRSCEVPFRRCSFVGPYLCECSFGHHIENIYTLQGWTQHISIGDDRAHRNFNRRNSISLENGLAGGTRNPLPSDLLGWT